ncbi:MAG: SinI family restriction endonuclease [Bacillota bacterium]|nr:SinI family restriction endonuclease [Bacillota bacterium]
MPRQERKKLSDFNVTKVEIEDAFKKLFSDCLQHNEQIKDLNVIFKIAITNLSLFPNFNLPTGSTYKDYIDRWIHGYSEALKNIPSEKEASPKLSCSDPAIKTIVQNVTKASNAEAEQQNSHHNLFMSAENIQGNLLEEYINKNIRPLDWYWCAGNVLRAVDFCSPKGPVLLQIKNKSNTENSSSGAIRIGTDIKKWYRLGTKTQNRVKIPDYKWEKLNEIINQTVSKKGLKASMNEEDYQNFLATVAKKNSKIITDK